MIGSVTRHGGRSAKVLSACGVALVLVTAGCKSSKVVETNPSISVKESRGASGALESVTVSGKGFASNGAVHLTFLLAVSGSNAEPYVEDDIQADASGKIHYQKQPLPCPQPADYGKGSWITATARDTASGISSTAAMHPGKAPDCGS